MAQEIIDRLLPERAHLMFYFPQPEQRNVVVRLPFFENPKISEKKRARYQKYNLISRSSNLYAYTGADSRKMSLTFYMTLPHIMEEYPYVTKQKFIYESKFSSFDADKDKFKKRKDTDPSRSAELYTEYFFKTDQVRSAALQVLNTEFGKNGLTQPERDHMMQLYAIDQSDIDDQNAQNARVASALSTVTGNQIEANELDRISAIDRRRQRRLSKTEEEKLKIIDVLLYWINVIRASVVNNSENPVLGPPVVRLSHGLMYQDVPCLCTDYALEFEEPMGYDLQTLLPRRVKITMNLEEFRAGDFGKQDRANIVKRDNLAGWEVIFKSGKEHIETLDPGYNFGK
jgi:hypothetical protein